MTDPAIPAWEPHPEVWLLVAALIGLGVYAARVIQPKAVAAGGEPITWRQKAWFIAGVAVFWISADYPLHEIAEQRLYSLHMLQHSLLMLVFPPMMLLATPTWLARLIVGDGGFKRFVYFWSRPGPALAVNLALTAITHWAWVVNMSVENGPLHYFVHLVMVISSLFVWMSICGPIPELQVGPPMKMVVIFMLSIIPTLPAAFLTTAETVIYQSYNHSIRLWDMSVETDQQLAGVIMKVVSGMYLWVLIGTIFFRWSLAERGEKQKYRGKLVTTASAVSSAPSSESTDG